MTANALTLDSTPAIQTSTVLPGLAQLGLRLGLGGVFWASARTKVDGLLTVSDSTFWLFEEEYALPVISSDIAAYLATYAEHLFPLMLVVGLGSRFAALGLFVMAAVIQLFVYPDALLSTHLGWLAMAGAVMVFGPGRFSLDHLLARRWGRVVQS